ncbi:MULTISPECIES: SDR family oxidoreductase [Streptomyces]|uniref:SDR family oxidoreductase n=1 Tax=Streptomyces TaxID=1883 RepID=UPI000241AF00|nr:MULTISPECIES: SDR family oxidoreductase [Streptomyces]EHM27499.1 putative short chain oxidoreductase [Streptomyces sp. W007]MCX4486289.1 SDR family oxidoreductase [Streptomyces anulatus]WSI79160.1 SDR family oxidoreductase [Streptomyces anulatus]WTD26467.1 SDR family oxidoreductase [Streptomyces anulatus]
MTTTLITGANKGLGYETARRLTEAGHTVLLGARDPRRGRAAAERIGARFLPLDVTGEESVLAAADRVREEFGHLDVLVNNAGITGPRKEAAELTADDIKKLYDTNVFGAVRVTRAFLPLLRAGESPTVVNVSSGLGSLAIAAEPERFGSLLPVYYPSLGYNSSKAALNMITVQYAKAFPEITFNAVDPGWTATDLNDHRGVQTVEEGAAVIVRMATLGGDGPTGGFFGNTGPVPW